MPIKINEYFKNYSTSYNKINKLIFRKMVPRFCVPWTSY